MRLRVLSSRAALEGMVALVAAVVTALIVGVLSLTAVAADVGARDVLAAGSGADTGLDLSLPLSPEAERQDARVREAVRRVMPVSADISLTRIETAGLVDLAAGRGYLAEIGGDPLPLAAGRWPAGPGEAALSAVVAEDLGIGVGDTVDLPGARVIVTGLWASSPAADDRWFGVRAGFATGGGEGPLAVESSVVSGVDSAAEVTRRVHWSIHLGAAGASVSTLRDVATAWRALPDALTAAGEETADLDTAGALLPTAQLVTSRAASLEAAAPVALATAALASLAVTALFAVLLVDASAPERRIRWARGQPTALIVRSQTVRALTAGLVGAVLGALASALVVPPPVTSVPAAMAVVGGIAAVPAVLIALLVAADVRRMTRGGGAAPLARRWSAGIVASVLLLIAALTTARLVSLRTTLGPGRNGPALDPLAVVAPAALLLTTALAGTAAVVLLPRRRRERRAVGAATGPFLSSVSRTRRPLTSGAVVVLVAAAIGQVSFAAMYQATWDSAFSTALAAQEGTAHRVIADGDDLTPSELDRIVTASGDLGVAPVWSGNTSIAARSASLVMATPSAVSALADPALGDVGRLAASVRADPAGPLLPEDANLLRVEVEARDARAAVASVVLLDEWGRLHAVAPDASGAIVVPPIATGPGGGWRVAAVDVAVTADAPYGAVVSVEGLSVGDQTLSLGASVMPVDISGDAIDLQPSPGPPSIAVSDETTRVRFVPVGSAAPVAVSQAFADSAGIAEGDTLPLSLVAGFESRPARVSAVVPAIPGAALPSAILVDAGAVVSARLRASTALPGVASAWLPAASATVAVSVVLPDGARLSGSSDDHGRTVLQTTSILLWCGAAGTTLLSVVGLVAMAMTARRRRRSEAHSLRAIGVDAATRRRVRMHEALGAVSAGAVVGVAAGAVTGAVLLPAVVTGAVPRAVGVAVTADPLVAVAAIGIATAAAFTCASVLAAADDITVRGRGR